MARTQRIFVRKQLQALIPNPTIASLALNTGFRKRNRQMDLSAFTWSLVCGFGAGGDRSIAALHDTYLSATDPEHQMNESSFGEWFRKREIVEWSKALVEHAMSRLDEEIDGDERLGAELAQFKDVLSGDSSLVRLHWSLQRAFPGTRTNHSPASLKLHLVQKVHGSGIKRIKITEGRRADNKTLTIGPWIKDSLLLIDLGFYDFGRFARVEKHGGYFISRVKTVANPTIVQSLRTHRGRSVPVDGEKLKDVLGRLTRKVIDLEVLVRFKTRKYKGKAHYKEQKLRMVGVWNEDEERYHLYFTNLSPRQLSAEGVAEAYKLRWQVELLFRQLKSIHGLGKVRTMNEDAAVALVYAAVLSLLVTRSLLEAIRVKLGLSEAETPFERGARAVQRQAVLILQLLASPPRDFSRLERRVERALLRKVVDRNSRHRRLLLGKRMNLMEYEHHESMTA